VHKIVIHSFKGGPGKSTIASNLAVSLCLRGKRVGIIDMDLAGPGLHVIFEVSKKNIRYTLNDALLNECQPRDAAIDLTKKLHLKKGKLVFVPAGYKAESIVGILQKGYELPMLRKAIEEISNAYSLDYLLVDTRPGIDESTILAIGLCDAMLLLTRIDKQDIFGSSVTLEVAKALKKPVFLIANMIPRREEKKGLTERLNRIFKVPVISEIPFDPDVHSSLSSGVFLLKYPEHTFSSMINSLTSTLVELLDEQHQRGTPHPVYAGSAATTGNTLRR
jgi:MinD-like ATPase involved in chromosome partitioning or flagellar assembly